MNGNRRFYKSVTTGPLGDGYGVFLDGRRLVTPAKKPLIVAGDAAAKLIAAEWDAQTETIVTASMPITRLVNVAIDRAPETREALADEVRKYVSSDLLCYPVSAPEKLANRQNETWQPILDWASQELGMNMKVAANSLALIQDEETLNKARELAADYDDLRLTTLTFLTGLLGSAILAFGMLKNYLQAEQAFAAIRIEEEHNAEIWGHDYEDQDKAEAKLADLKAVEKLLNALNRPMPQD